MSFFTIIGLLVGVIGIFLTVKAIKRKKLTIFSFNQQSTLKITDEIKKDVTIHYKKLIVNKIDKFELLISNTGNTYIDEKDVVNPIEIIVPSTGQILKYDLIKESSNHIKTKINLINNKKLSIQFILLKPKDSIRIYLICSDIDNTELQYSGRIVGQPEISDQKFKKRETLLGSTKQLIIFTPLLLIMSIMVFFLAFNFAKNYTEEPLTFPTYGNDSFNKVNLVFLREDNVKIPVMLNPEYKKMIGFWPIIDPTITNRLDSLELKELTREIHTLEAIIEYEGIDAFFSDFDSLGIIKEYGKPISITTTYSDTLNYLCIRYDTWKYKPLGFIKTFSKLKKTNSYTWMIYFFYFLLLMLILANIVNLIIISSLIKRWKLLSKEEKKRIVGELKKFNFN